MRGDSLFIALPEAIAADSLEVSFTARLLQNAALFALDLGTNERPGLWQSVEAMSRRANIVLLPELTGSRWLIDDLAIDPPVFTPNGDGINDRVAIRFAVLKVAAPAPQVDIFDLSGHQVARLSPSSTGSLLSYLWDGVDMTGRGRAAGDLPLPHRSGRSDRRGRCRASDRAGVLTPASPHPRVAHL